MSESGKTPIEAQPENRTGIIEDETLIKHDDKWTKSDYASVPIPNERDRPKWEWTTDERRAELLRLIRKHGHPDNLPNNQTEYGEIFDVSQQCISEDLKVLREYIATKAGHRAISDTELIAERAKRELLDEDPYKAFQVQLDYNEWLFEMGKLERAPDKKEVKSMNINADAADDLTDEEREQFDKLAEMLRSEEEDDDVIDVGGSEVEDGS